MLIVDERGKEFQEEAKEKKVYPKRRLEAQGNFVIVKADTPQDKTASGLHIPENSRETEFKGTVIAAGPGEYLSNGQFVENKYKTGDRVVFHPGGCMGMNWKMDDDPDGKPEMLLVMKTYDIYALID